MTRKLINIIIVGTIFLCSGIAFVVEQQAPVKPTEKAEVAAPVKQPEPSRKFRVCADSTGTIIPGSSYENRCGGPENGDLALTGQAGGCCGDPERLRLNTTASILLLGYICLVPMVNRPLQC